MRNDSLKGNSGVDTTGHSEHNVRSRASQSSAGVGGGFGHSNKPQENPQRISFSKNQQKLGHQQMDQNKQFDDPSSYTISPVPSAQALAVAEQKSLSGVAGQQLQTKDQQLKQNCQVLLKDAEHLDASGQEQFLVKQSKSIKSVQ